MRAMLVNHYKMVENTILFTSYFKIVTFEGS